MFHRVEASNYRCLQSVNQPVDSFQILVGPNASGKSSFLDVIAFLGKLVGEGLEAAVEERTRNFHDLVWGREGNAFHLAIEATIPVERRHIIRPPTGTIDTVRYEVSVRLDTMAETLHIAEERVTVFSAASGVQSGVGVLSRLDNTCHLISERELGRVELEWHRNYASLNVLAGQESQFPAATWLKERLREGIRPVQLDIGDLRRPSPPAQSEARELRGSYLARWVAHLGERHPSLFLDWVAHIRTVLPEVESIGTVLQDWDKHRYVTIRYKSGVQVPSWMLSDGTLRLLALTILAYQQEFKGTYLIEEPENGVHPIALEAIYQSLSSVDGQVLTASHSTLLLNMAKPEEILCFVKTPEGIEIVRGSEHPALRDWRGEVSLGMLAASGILG